MKSRTDNWFECKIRYDKTAEDGTQRKVVEAYVVNAMSFTEAEARITEEMSAYISGEFEVTDIKRAPYREILFSDDDLADRWYKAKIDTVIIDEKTEKEKRAPFHTLVHAGTLPSAVKHIESFQSGSLADYIIASVAETKIMDVFDYAVKANPTQQADDKPEYEV